MIQGKNIALRSWQKDDVPFVRSIRNDVQLQALALARSRQSSEDRVVDWLRARSTGDSSLLLIVASAQGGQPYGYIQATGIDAISRRCEIGVIVAAQYQGKGFGGEALDIFMRLMWQVFGVTKFFLQVRADNAPAIKLYERLGFKRAGLLERHFFFDNSWFDVVLMERLGSSE